MTSNAAVDITFCCCMRGNSGVCSNYTIHNHNQEGKMNTKIIKPSSSSAKAAGVKCDCFKNTVVNPRKEGSDVMSKNCEKSGCLPKKSFVFNPMDIGNFTCGQFQSKGPENEACDQRNCIKQEAPVCISYLRNTPNPEGLDATFKGGRHSGCLPVDEYVCTCVEAGRNDSKRVCDPTVEGHAIRGSCNKQEHHGIINNSELHYETSECNDGKGIHSSGNKYSIIIDGAKSTRCVCKHGNVADLSDLFVPLS